VTNGNRKRILVIGACGQIGSELTQKLREQHGGERVIAADYRVEANPALCETGPLVFVDVTQRETLEAVVAAHEIDTIYHLAAILSAKGEKNPHKAWDVNVNGLRNVLEVARAHAVGRIFWPSSIAVFGPETPRHDTPQETILRPTTMYGITKVTGELMCNYYCAQFGLDIRGVRYPGIISSETLPGGGTTDYAVEIFYAALERGCYTCFVKPDTVLPMMYMPDCIRATRMLMEADPARLRHHAEYNLAGLSFSAAELAAEIERHLPDFVCEYAPDQRQAIADSWPCTIDDSAARADWGWTPKYDLPAMVTDMLKHLRAKVTT
jgi:nucleoside-diphosphate-sugar epimerase